MLLIKKSIDFLVISRNFYKALDLSPVKRSKKAEILLERDDGKSS
jgi:hypothetical protein